MGFLSDFPKKWMSPFLKIVLIQDYHVCIRFLARENSRTLVLRYLHGSFLSTADLNGMLSPIHCISPRSPLGFNFFSLDLHSFASPREYHAPSKNSISMALYKQPTSFSCVTTSAQCSHFAPAPSMMFPLQLVHAHASMSRTTARKPCTPRKPPSLSRTQGTVHEIDSFG